MQPGEPLHILAETKFHPPLLREDVILGKPLVDDRYAKLASHSLTRLSAPAGCALPGDACDPQPDRSGR